MIDIWTVRKFDETSQKIIKDFEEQTGIEFGVGANCNARALVEFYGGKVEYRYPEYNLIYQGPGNKIIYVLNKDSIGRSNPENVVLLKLFSHFLLSGAPKKYELGEIIYPDKRRFVDPEVYKKEIEQNKSSEIKRLKFEIDKIDSGEARKELIAELESYDPTEVVVKKHFVKRKRYKIIGRKLREH